VRTLLGCRRIRGYPPCPERSGASSEAVPTPHPALPDGGVHGRLVLSDRREDVLAALRNPEVFSSKKAFDMLRQSNFAGYNFVRPA